MDITQHMALKYTLSKKMLTMDTAEAIKYAWNYFYRAPFKWYGHSSKLNIKTEVFTCSELFNFGYPSGTILHFTQENTIYGKSTDINENGKPYGNNPIYYWGNFEINNYDFELSFDALKIGEIQFIPKKEIQIIEEPYTLLF
jgi:hypothetical protein